MSNARMDTDETHELIASDKVEGTTVYGRDGEKLGSIQNFMVGKRSGQVEYAVLKFGGPLGVGSDFYPLPWTTLTYDTDKGGYVVDIAKDTLERDPHYGDETPNFDRAYGERIHGAYGLDYPV